MSRLLLRCLLNRLWLRRFLDRLRLSSGLMGRLWLRRGTIHYIMRIGVSRKVVALLNVLVLNVILTRVLIDQVMSWFKVPMWPLMLIVEAFKTWNGVMYELTMFSVMHTIETMRQASMR